MSTIEERVTLLEKRIAQLDRVEEQITGLRTDFNAYRRENAAILERILSTLQDLQRRPIVFRWPWERV